MKLLLSGLIKFSAGLLLVGALLFLSAGSLSYGGGWLLLGLLFLAMPLVLGSWYALIPMAFYPVIIIVRLLDKEKLLTRELPGYEAYKKKVKYRLIPFVW